LPTFSSLEEGRRETNSPSGTKKTKREEKVPFGEGKRRGTKEITLYNYFSSFSFNFFLWKKKTKKKAL
jgi:hypothetical protein